MNLPSKYKLKCNDFTYFHPVIIHSLDCIMVVPFTCRLLAPLRFCDFSQRQCETLTAHTSGTTINMDLYLAHFKRNFKRNKKLLHFLFISSNVRALI